MVSGRAIQGVLSEGLLAPGEVVASSGRVLPVTHGSRFGDGRYLSPDVHTAAGYAFADASGKQQVLLCLVAPGRCERLPPGIEQAVAEGAGTIRRVCGCCCWGIS